MSGHLDGVPVMVALESRVAGRKSKAGTKRPRQWEQKRRERKIYGTRQSKTDRGWV